MNEQMKIEVLEQYDLIVDIVDVITKNVISVNNVSNINDLSENAKQFIIDSAIAIYQKGKQRK